MADDHTFAQRQSEESRKIRSHDGYRHSCRLARESDGALRYTGSAKPFKSVEPPLGGQILWIRKWNSFAARLLSKYRDYSVERFRRNGRLGQPLNEPLDGNIAANAERNRE